MRIPILLFLLVLILLIPVTHGTFEDYSPRADIFFIDVGLGESILIVAPLMTVLIDGGTREEGGKAVLDLLEELGVKRIDIMVATHPSDYHIGGLITVLESPIEVPLVVSTPYVLTTREH